MKYYDVSNEKIVSLDIETYDPKLIKEGPGVFRKDSYIVGFSIAFENGTAEYYNIGHPDVTPELQRENTKYLDYIVSSGVPKIGANLLYDLDHICNGLGIKLNGRLHDVQVAEPLLNEYSKSYRLDSLSKLYGGKGKNKTKAEDYCKEEGWSGDVRQWLWKMPYYVVRDYAIADALEPLRIFKEQRKKLKEEGLWELYRMEMDLYPLYMIMRKNGIRIDSDYVKRTKTKLAVEVTNIKNQLYDEIGWSVNWNSSKQLAKLFDALLIPYGYTEKGNPSITKSYMSKIDNPTVKKLLRARKYDKCLSTFLEGSFTKFDINGRIHASFHPLRGDEYGTVSGRFSSSNPNLQQVPSRDKELGPMCRRSFVAEDGYKMFRIDYSQLEYRIIAHYAQGKKSEDIRKKYNDDPTTDYHQVIMDMTGLDRKSAKNLNFGMAFGMSIPSMATLFGWSLDKAKMLYDTYNEIVPFVKYSFYKVKETAERRGYIRTILGRRARITSKNQKGRENSYSMFNRLMQGSGADIMKKSMLVMYQEGLLDEGRLFLSLQVHDEFVGSVPMTEQGAKDLWRLKEIMETCVPLKIPLKADLEIGDNWSEVKEVTTIEELKNELKI